MLNYKITDWKIRIKISVILGLQFMKLYCISPFSLPKQPVSGKFPVIISPSIYSCWGAFLPGHQMVTPKLFSWNWLSILVIGWIIVPQRCLYPNPRNLWMLPYMANKQTKNLCSWIKIRIWRWENYLGGDNVSSRILIRHSQEITEKGNVITEAEIKVI